jgi:cytochrome b pre-mRNA-processing protein 3
LPDKTFNGKSMILNRLFRNREKPERRLYAAIVAAARQAKFYQDMGVPDTIEGRFEMIILHIFLVLNRLKNQGAEDLRQNLTDEFFNDMDASLREFGVSDVAVGKKVRKLAEAYYGRILAYDKAVAKHELLGETIERNIFPEGAAKDVVEGMEEYIIAAVKSLSTLPTEKILRSELIFP